MAARGVTAGYTTTNVIKNLNKLISRGWLPLAATTQLLGYSSPVCLYQRQKSSKNPIPIVKVGKINRVTESVLVDEFKATADSNAHVRAVYDIYLQIKYPHRPNQHNQPNQPNQHNQSKLQESE